jgi:predicted P-loop ATPase
LAPTAGGATTARDQEDRKAAMKPRVIIGTSGSPDYLRDETGDRRFWTVRPEVSPEQSNEDELPATLRALIDEKDALIRLTPK